MPDTTTLDEIRAIAAVLWFMPAPARTQFATGLHQLGVRVHPHLAVKQVTSTDPLWLGAHRRQQLTNINSTADIQAIIADTNPTLAAQITTATTDADKTALLAQLRAANPQVETQAAALLNKLTADDDDQVSA